MLKLGMVQDKRDETSFFSKPKDETYKEIEANNLEVFIEEVYGLLKLSHPTEGELVLDANCGFGAWGIRLAKKGYVVVGADISKVQIKQAQEKDSSDNVIFMPILCDLERLPLRTQLSAMYLRLCVASL